MAERLVPSDRPRPDEVAVSGFSRDTAFVLGTDTLRAFLIPGHTAGSAAYLFRGVLFVGDALSWSPFTGFRPDKPVHSDDSARSRASVAALWERIPSGAVQWVCTAHAKCAAYDASFRRGARR
jgi:glyoxylase-like metal-dependent hydrolase (beta-lactamase superfamily II)